jgi:hypothetical protein
LQNNTLASGIILCGYRQKDANRRAVIFHALPAFDLNPTSVAFNKLLCDEQANAGAHGAAGGEEGFKYLGQISKGAYGSRGKGRTA